MHDDEEDEEAAEYRAWARRNLRNALGAAGLLRPDREITEESIQLEKKLRRDAQIRLDQALKSLAERRAAEREAVPGASVGPKRSGINDVEFASLLNDILKPDKPLIESMAEVWLEELREDAEQPNTSKRRVSDWEKAKEWLEIDGAITPQQFEKFAKGWISFVANEEAPSQSLVETFAYFKRELPTSTIDVPDGIKGVYARLVASDNEIMEAEFRREIGPLLDTWAESRHRKRPNIFTPGLVTGVAVLTSFWLGFRGSEFYLTFVPILAFVLYLIAFGPRSEDVQGQPNKGMMIIFSLVLSTGVCALGFAIGSLLNGS